MAESLAEIDARIAAQKKVVESSTTVQQAVDPSQVQGRAYKPTWWTAESAMTMSSVVLIFGVFVLLLVTYLIRIGKSSESVLRIFGTVLIVIVSVFLIVAGYDNNQIAPVMGLLGTIAGYLLGKETSKPASQDGPAKGKSDPA
ncbi:hypothetical protein [Leptothrix discophora]|uniref:Uncharacterized protein n=1 Tax=Leptothrix discophora TaxID=89 RepID=A0ABT9G1G9_LEPDI|nr:hypothetical protein [Leptothrix discophora]MDP4300331.1 hypothetical protein [Leptothrix discophora]